MPLMLLEAVNATAIMTIESNTIPTNIPALRSRCLRKTETVLMSLGMFAEEKGRIDFILLDSLPSMGTYLSVNGVFI